ncbi:DsrE family protein [Candidatus Venteria ishoeyi]|uniref:DsrE/DsrF-like family protein n=1 Tax=Candidatus Venteria ishoeyi TaxID=1899563 RepID=A0A1H6FIX9_9GAMM|nr:DsrE family protein [Candidatus Venteria ishoeyi]MDM8547885.1 DsrE family protein [Candidatus Venteria ishoeyi]SEH08974.1 DsrE/DsrF-like family protein [Candidatus Venteria ishoeyi]
MKSFSLLLVGPLLLLFSAVMQAAEKPDDAMALKGVSEGKVIFDVNIKDAKKLTLYLMVVRETIDDLKRQGVKPDVILAFRGLSVKLVSKDRENVDLAEFGHLDKIASQLADLQEQGARVEVCSVATRLFNIKNDNLLDGLKAVGNTFVSLTGYQAQGYANIPLY